jgi:hypothetical protein
MGFSRDWQGVVVKDGYDPIFQKDVKQIFEIAKSLGVNIADGNGKKEDGYTILGDIVAFNGLGKDSHETCHISSSDSGYNFCKTNEKPYDGVVKAFLTIAEEWGYITDVRDVGVVPESDELCNKILTKLELSKQILIKVGNKIVMDVIPYPEDYNFVYELGILEQKKEGHSRVTIHSNGEVVFRETKAGEPYKVEVYIGKNYFCRITTGVTRVQAIKEGGKIILKADGEVATTL